MPYHLFVYTASINAEEIELVSVSIALPLCIQSFNIMLPFYS